MYTDKRSYDGKVQLMDVTSDEFLHNPYKFYRERREAGDLIEVMKDSYSVMGYDIAEAILRSRDFGNLNNVMNLNNPEMQEIYNANPVLKIISNWMLFHNPPKHTRLRHLVSKAFTPKMVSELEETMRGLIREQIAGIENKNHFNFITEISYPYPVSVISEMLGLPKEDIPKFRRWSQDFAVALAMDVTALPEQHRQQLNQSARELTKYFENILSTKAEQIEEGKLIDLLTMMITAKEDGDSLSTEEILANATLLLVAGHETTTNLLGNGLYALISNPDQYKILQDDYSLIPNAVEEFLRFDPPVQSVGRSALTDTEVLGMEFKQGTHFAVSLGGVAHDPNVNPNPEQFDIRRDDPKHLSFSKGIHYCLGAPLARLEAKVAFEEINDLLPDLELKNEPTRRPNWLLRGFSSLPVGLQ